MSDRKISSESDLYTANLPKYDSHLINSLPDPISVLYSKYLFEQKSNVRLKMNEENYVTSFKPTTKVKSPHRSKSARRANTSPKFIKN